MKTVYLAGPITGLDYDEASDWRQQATTLLREAGIAGVSPMRNKEFLRGRGVLEGAYPEDILSTSRGIMTRDRYDCTHCDAVLFNLAGADRVSIGTMIEIGWADANRIPTVGIMEDGGIHTHPMVHEGINFWCADLDEALHALISVLGPHDPFPFKARLDTSTRIPVSLTTERGNRI